MVLLGYEEVEDVGREVGFGLDRFEVEKVGKEYFWVVFRSLGIRDYN